MQRLGVRVPRSDSVQRVLRVLLEHDKGVRTSLSSKKGMYSFTLLERYAIDKIILSQISYLDRCGIWIILINNLCYSIQCYAQLLMPI